MKRIIAACMTFAEFLGRLALVTAISVLWTAVIVAVFVAVITLRHGRSSPPAGDAGSAPGITREARP